MMGWGWRVRADKSAGFTIVELLIVIIVIGILATLVLIGYNGVQDQARKAKYKSDLKQLSQAIQVARSNTGMTLYDITGSPTAETRRSCIIKPNGTDLAVLPTTDACWQDYYTAMTRIEAAAKVGGLKNMTDPWGRPYAIDENESDVYASQGYCEKDYVYVYPRPFTTGPDAMPNTTVFVPNGHTGC